MIPAIFLALLIEAGAVADVPAAAPACRKPDLLERVDVTQDELADASEGSRAYVDCMRSFIDEQTRLANSLMAEARSHAEANNTAANEVNAFITAYRRWANERRLAR